MEERGVSNYSEMPSAEVDDVEQAGGDGPTQENPSYHNGYFASNTGAGASETNRSPQGGQPASNTGDRSSEMGRVIKVWSHQAAGWRFVYAKYIDDQIPKGRPGHDDEWAWTDYKDQG